MYRTAFVVAAAVLATSVPVSTQQPRPLGAPTTRATVIPRPNPSGAIPKLLPGTRSNIFAAIQGNALNATNGALANAQVRLRDARFGRIADTQITDKSGLFAFRPVDPGTYIVELMGNDSRVAAASSMLNVDAGEVASAVVKLPFTIAPLAGLLGHTVPSAMAVSSAAAASGVLATAVTGVEASNTRIIQ